MDSDYGIPRELSDLQKLRSSYQPELPPCLKVSVFPLRFFLSVTIYFGGLFAVSLPDFGGHLLWFEI
jgi:hypothetical protein